MTTSPFTRSLSLSLLVCAVLVMAQQGAMGQRTIQRGVVGGGGIRMSVAGAARMDGTVSQTAIGIVRAEKHVGELGFWYTVTQAKPGYTTITIPNVQASIGQQFTLPVLHRSSSVVFRKGPKSFTMRIRFNKTMLEPLDPVALSETENDYIVTLTGTTADTMGTIAELNLRPRLGNDTATAIVVEEFRWTDTRRPLIQTVDGTFTSLGICKEGGTPRLVRTINTTSVRAFPNPAVSTTTVGVRLFEASHAKVSLHRISGEFIMTIGEGDMTKGDHTFPVDVSTLGSGSYMLRLETEREVLSHQLLISK
jgi:hypothetical protein